MWKLEVLSSNRLYTCTFTCMHRPSLGSIKELCWGEKSRREGGGGGISEGELFLIFLQSSEVQPVQLNFALLTSDAKSVAFQKIFRKKPDICVSSM